MTAIFNTQENIVVSYKNFSINSTECPLLYALYSFSCNRLLRQYLCILICIVYPG